MKQEQKHAGKDHIWMPYMAMADMISQGPTCSRVGLFGVRWQQQQQQQMNTEACPSMAQRCMYIVRQLSSAGSSLDFTAAAENKMAGKPQIQPLRDRCVNSLVACVQSLLQSLHQCSSLSINLCEQQQQGQQTTMETPCSCS